MYCKERYMKNNPRAAKRALCSLFWGDSLHYTVHMTQLCAQWKSVESLCKMTSIYCTGSIEVPQSNTDKSQKVFWRKTGACRDRSLKTNQTKWEWHHNTFTPSLHLVPFCHHLHKYALCLLVVCRERLWKAVGSVVVGVWCILINLTYLVLTD